MRKIAAFILGCALIGFSGFVNADGFDFHLYLEGGLGGCETSSGGIHACENGVTNEIALRLQWYEKGNLYFYSDRRHSSRLENEDFDKNAVGPSGTINTWCYICAGYRLF